MLKLTFDDSILASSDRKVIVSLILLFDATWRETAKLLGREQMPRELYDIAAGVLSAQWPTAKVRVVTRG